MRKTLRTLTTCRLDGRSALAVAVRTWKANIRRDLGGDLTRAQETLLDLATQTWVQVSSLDDWLARQPSLVIVRKRTVLPVLMQRTALAESLAKHLERLGLGYAGSCRSSRCHEGAGDLHVAVVEHHRRQLRGPAAGRHG